MEIPAIFDTLIKNGYYEESMDLQIFIQRLVTRYPNIPTFEMLLESCNKSGNLMLQQITNLLRGPVKLALLIRVVGYLRRIKDLNETQLACCFLQQRDAYLESQLQAIQDQDDPQAYIKRYIDTTRKFK